MSVWEAWIRESSRSYKSMRNQTRFSGTEWRRLVGCLIVSGHFSQQSRIINGSFAKNDLQLRHPTGLRHPSRITTNPIDQKGRRCVIQEINDTGNKEQIIHTHAYTQKHTVSLTHTNAHARTRTRTCTYICLILLLAPSTRRGYAV